jgi:hypothetical protein
MSLKDLLKALEPLKEILKEIDKKDAPYRKVEGENLSGTLNGYCPVQGKGHADGHPWYFRARWDSWSFSMSDDINGNPIEVRWGKEPGWYFEGFYDNASWMEYKDASDVIIACVERFRAGEGYTNPNILEKE